jgi:hypothetical protein
VCGSVRGLACNIRLYCTHCVQAQLLQSVSDSALSTPVASDSFSLTQLGLPSGSRTAAAIHYDVYLVHFCIAFRRRLGAEWSAAMALLLIEGSLR